MLLVALYNPVCGDSTAKQFFNEQVLPLLAQNGKTVDKVLETDRVGHAGELLVSYLETEPGPVTVVLGSGDGTLHEIINSLSLAELKGVRAGGPPLSLSFVLVPCGTANALFSSIFPPQDPPEADHRLKGVWSFIKDVGTIPLTLAITTLSSPPAEKKIPAVVISAVVTSTCLHASILHDSEVLRKDYPGLERYKMAAQQNASKWYHSHVKLLPTASGLVQQYDPASQTFTDHQDSDDDNPIVDLYGPFAYFLSTVNVDRLEPTFRISPLARALPTEGASCDIVIVRPFRGKASMDTKETRASFVANLWAVMTSAYQNGSHVDLRYQEDGSVGVGGDGEYVVEYIRCGGWEWIPDDVDNSAHLLCSDGSISHIPVGGRAVCSAATPSGEAGFKVYA
ncbi:hypothetical protein BDZ89DRAFT_1019369 [Hymenopellis radicata]|nr:hypothetical protein BDZ89DRAFT_1019369 [Hymenopellis radicata]